MKCTPLYTDHGGAFVSLMYVLVCPEEHWTCHWLSNKFFLLLIFSVLKQIANTKEQLSKHMISRLMSRHMLKFIYLYRFDVDNVMILFYIE